MSINNDLCCRTTIDDKNVIGINCPTTVFFNSNGEIVGETEIGAHSYDEWAAILDDLL